MVEYAVWEDDGKAETRKYLYKLQDLSVVEWVQIKEGGFFTYRWRLTEKGKELVDSNRKLKKLLEERDLVRFYERVIEELGLGI